MPLSVNEPLDPFPFFGWLLNKKAARVEVNISLAFLHWVPITFHLFVSDIAIFVLKTDIKLQLTNSAISNLTLLLGFQRGYEGSKTLLQEISLVLNCRCQLTLVVIYNGHKMAAVVIAGCHIVIHPAISIDERFV